MFSQTPKPQNQRSEPLNLQPNNSISFQNFQPSPQFLEFINKYNELINISNIVLTDPNQITNLEVILLETCKSINSYRSKLPDDFVFQSNIVSFLMNLISSFENAPLVLERTSILLFYVINSSKQALLQFLQLNPQQYILDLFNSKNPKENQVCYEILIRLNDPNCQDIGSQNFFETLNLYYAIIERADIILKEINLSDPANSAYNDNIQLLLRVILGFTNVLPINEISKYKELLYPIFMKVLTYEDEKIRISLSKYAIYSLFFLTKDQLYKDIIDNDLFKLSMTFIENKQTASFATLLAIQMLQVSSDDKKYFDEIVPLLDHPLLKSHEYFLQTNDIQLLRYILTLFTNSICFRSDLTDVLSGEADLAKLYELIQHDNPDIQQGAIWCIWNILRFGNFDVLKRILRFSDLREDLVEISFLMDDISFIKAVLVPSIMKVYKSITSAGVLDESPYSEFMKSIVGPLRELCYKEDSPEIMSIAASCLKAVFPDVYNNENFS